MSSSWKDELAPLDGPRGAGVPPVVVLGGQGPPPSGERWGACHPPRWMTFSLWMRERGALLCPVDVGGGALSGLRPRCGLVCRPHHPGS